MPSADGIYHIETHFGYCTKQKLSITVYPAEMCFYMVGAPGLEPEIGRLKVCCDTISPHPHMVPLVGVEPTRHGLRVRHAALTSQRDDL